MAIQDKLDLLIKFDLPVLPFFSLQDTTDYGSEGISSSDVKGNFTISNPLGQIYTNGSWVTPDITLSISPYFNSVLVPLDNGSPLPGQYTFAYTIQVTGGTQPGIYTKSFVINYTYISPMVSIVFDNNPYVALLTARDNTRYVIDGITPTQSRIFTLIFPDLSGFTDIVNSLTYIAVTNPFYIDGLYQSTVSSELNYTFLTYNVHDLVAGSGQILVEDTTDIQSVYCCLKKLNDKVNANPNDLVGIAVLTRATSLLEMFNQAVQFGDYTGANNFIAQIYAVTGCTKGCTCGNFKKTSIQPYWQTVNTPTPAPGTGTEFRVGDHKDTWRTDSQSNWEYMTGQVFKIVDLPDYYNVVGTTFNTGSEPPGYFRNADFRGRAAIMAGQGIGLTNRVLGTNYGAEFVNATHHHAVSLSASGNTPVLNSTDVAISGTIPISAGTCSVTISGATDPLTRSLTISPITPAGTIDITGLITNADTTGGTSLSIIGDGTTLNPVFSGDPVPYTPAGSVTLPTFDPGGIGTLNTNVAGSVSGNTDDQSLSIAGSGSVPATHDSCIRVVTDLGTTDVAPCADMHVDIAAVAALLSINPNPHNHSLSALPLDISQGFSGALDPPSFTGSSSFSGTPDDITATGTVSILANDIAAALSIDPNPHTHSIPGLTLTGSATFLGTPQTPTGIVDVGGVAFSASGSGTTTTPDATASLTGGTASIPATAISLSVSGNTADAVLNLAITMPVIAVMKAVKVK